MGDILSGIFGGGQRQTQATTVDAVTRGLNELRSTQAQDLLGDNPLWSFGQPQPELYTPTAATQQLLNQGVTDLTTKSPYSFENYMGLMGNRGLLEQGTGYGAGVTDQAITNAQAETQQAITGVDQRTTDALAGLDSRINAGVAGVNAGVGSGLSSLDADYQNAMQLSNQRLRQALALGSSGMGGYLAQVATPQIMQQMALQGLEGGGAVPEAIARAGAEVAMPFLTSTLSQYGQEQSGLSLQDMQLAQALQTLGISTNAGLQGTGAQLASGLQQNATGLVSGLIGQDVATAAGLRQAQANQAGQLFGQQMGNEASFIQNLPSAFASFTQAPAQAALTRAQAASTLSPLADYPRALAAEDYNRRQGLATTSFTGIPYTPQTNVAQRTSSQPLFNFFGQG